MLEGKKTYLAAFAIVSATIAQKAGFNIPPETWTVLGAFGLYGLRKAIGKKEAA